MPNDRLRDVLMTKGLTPEEVSERLGVDPKTVERWITVGRTPYPRYRHAIAVMAGESETYLWPKALPSQRRTEVAQSEIVQVYPHRSSLPGELWDSLLERATTYVDMLKALRDKGENGARIRLLFGDRNAPAVTQRSLDEGIGENTIAAKIDHALAFFSQLAGAPGIEIRPHGTVLYNSIYRSDDEMIVNPHVHGKVASHAPALHLRRLSAGDLFTTYEDSFTAVWEGATHRA